MPAFNGSERLLEVHETALPIEEPKDKAHVVVHEKKSSFIGLIWCLLHVFLLASATTLAKFISVPAELKLITRCSVQFTLLLPTVQYQTWKHHMDVLGRSLTTLKTLLFCAFAGPLGALCLYQALDRISLGDAVALTFTNAVFAGIISRIFLKEAYTLLDLFFAFLSFSGVVFIAKPTFLFGESEKTYGLYELGGIGLALLNALIMGSWLIAIRRLGKTNPILNVFYFSLGGICTAPFAFALGNYSIPCIKDLVGAFGIGFLGLSSQLAVTKALQTERASTVAIIRCLQLVVVLIYQVILFDDIPNAFSIAGSFLLLSSVLGMTLRKCYHESRVADKTK